MGLTADFTRLSATQLAVMLRKRSVSAVELCEAAIDRIETLDGPVNAVVAPDFERARADARSADNALAKGQTLPLLGVPMTVKEGFDLKGHATTWGFTEHRSHRADSDALAVHRLKAAGAIVLGKTNVPTALLDWQTDNPVYGRTRNPYSAAHTPGGSSGGSAAAVAMGYSALELGSDIGGSIRVPSAFCGVFGLKTTFGIVPLNGHAPGGRVQAPTPLNVAGPIARSAEDLMLALDVIAGPDGDAPFNRLVLPAPRHSRISGYRVLLLDRHPAASVDSVIRQALESVANALSAAGASVMRESSFLPDLAAIWRTYQSILHTITTRDTPAPGGRAPVSAHTWMNHLDDQLRQRRLWADFFRHFDIVLCPAFSTPAFPHTDEPDWRKRSLSIDGEATPFGAQLVWASMATAGNLPAAVAPVGMSPDGLPIGVQCIAAHLEDKTAAHFAGLIAREIPPPPSAA